MASTWSSQELKEKPGSSAPPACQTTRALKEKPGAPHYRRDLVDLCEGRVEDAEWKPQLDSAVWPEDKVKALDSRWEACENQVRPEPTPAPTPVFTTTTTTIMEFKGPVDGGVDFGFMTSDKTPQKGRGGIVNWFNRNILRRRQRNMNNFEEVVGLHTCKKRSDEGKSGGRDQTYYASSLCYWLPDIERVREPKTVGLQWNGGSEGRKSLCNVLSGAGKCVKCSVCHDNAISASGKVSSSAFPEEIALPPGCLKETEIEGNATMDFDIKNRPLKTENDRCTGVKASYTLANERYMKADSTLTELNKMVDEELPSRIADKQAIIISEGGRLKESQEEEWIYRREIQSDEGNKGCKGHNLKNGQSYWYSQATREDFPTGELLRIIYSFLCSDPYCNACQETVESLRTVYEKSVEFAANKELAQQHLDQLNVQLAKKTAERDTLKDEVPILKAARDAAFDTWDPQAAACETTFTDYISQRNAYIQVEAPAFYDRSCEKACIEISATRSEGCGVMEGTAPNQPTGRGGIVNMCNPPQPSWVKGPWTYNAPEESGMDQCGRLFQAQKPQHANIIRKSGWMQKSGRYGGWWFGMRKYVWTRRFFVLESGDDVRSGTLRYWEKDPNIAKRAVERHAKFIILWDAKSVQQVSGSKYRRRGNECFKLYHFYRDYRFCVEGGNAAAERNDWFKKVKSEIRDLGGR